MLPTTQVNGIQQLQEIKRRTAAARQGLEITDPDPRPTNPVAPPQWSWRNPWQSFRQILREGQTDTRMHADELNHQEVREKFNRRAQTGSQQNLSGVRSAVLDDAVHNRAVAQLRKTQCYTAIKTGDSIEMTSRYYSNKIEMLQQTVSDEKMRAETDKHLRLVHARILGNLSAMSVGPEIDFEQFDGGEL